jgi:hypothetical protein
MDKFFIVGCPRSGTTMVQQALNRHSQVAIPPETKYFFSFLGHSRRNQARHVRRLNSDLNINLPEPTTAVRSADEGRSWYEDMARQYVERLGKPGVSCFGEKTPEHTGQLSRIRELYPKAKIVVLYRDGRDVALSLSRVPWASPDLYVNFLVWLYYYEVVRREIEAGAPNLYFARYEDIVMAPQAELGGILRFLGLPYESAVVQGCGNSEGIPTREYGWKKRALEKISTDRVSLFRRELSAEQIAALESLGRHALPSLGYSMLTDGKTPLSATFFLKLAYHLARFVCRLPWRSMLNEALARFFRREAHGLAPLPTSVGLHVNASRPCPSCPEAVCPTCELVSCGAAEPGCLPLSLCYSPSWRPTTRATAWRERRPPGPIAGRANRVGIGEPRELAGWRKRTTDRRARRPRGTNGLARPRLGGLIPARLSPRRR